MKRKICFFALTAFIVILCFSGGSTALLFFYPAGFAALGSFLWPDRVFPAEVTINRRHYRISAYCKPYAHDQNGKMMPAVLLCNLPLSPSNRSPHLKLFRDWIGVFQDPGEWFQVGRNYALIREGALISIPLEDDMKGWDTEYSVREDQDRIRYEIFPSGPQQPDHITISVPLRYLKDMPRTSAGGKTDAQGGLHFLPYRKPQ